MLSGDNFFLFRLSDQNKCFVTRETNTEKEYILFEKRIEKTFNVRNSSLPARDINVLCTSYGGARNHSPS